MSRLLHVLFGPLPEEGVKFFGSKLVRAAEAPYRARGSCIQYPVLKVLPLGAPWGAGMRASLKRAGIYSIRPTLTCQ